MYNKEHYKLTVTVYAGKDYYCLRKKYKRWIKHRKYDKIRRRLDNAFRPYTLGKKVCKRYSVIEKDRDLGGMVIYVLCKEDELQRLNLCDRDIVKSCIEELNREGFDVRAKLTTFDKSGSFIYWEFDGSKYDDWHFLDHLYHITTNGGTK